MEVPVCLEKRRVGTLAVTPSGTDTVFRVRCTGLPAGLYRLYACGDGGELLLDRHLFHKFYDFKNDS